MRRVERRQDVLWVYLMLAETCYLASSIERLVADGTYTAAWTDAADLQAEPPAMPYAQLNQG